MVTSKKPPAPPAMERITYRVSAARKATMQRLANKDGRTLSNWIERQLDLAIKAAEGKK